MFNIVLNICACMYAIVCVSICSCVWVLAWWCNNSWCNGVCSSLVGLYQYVIARWLHHGRPRQSFEVIDVLRGFRRAPSWPWINGKAMFHTLLFPWPDLLVVFSVGEHEHTPLLRGHSGESSTHSEASASASAGEQLRGQAHVSSSLHLHELLPW